MYPSGDDADVIAPLWISVVDDSVRYRADLRALEREGAGSAGVQLRIGRGVFLSIRSRFHLAQTGQDAGFLAR